MELCSAETLQKEATEAMRCFGYESTKEQYGQLGTGKKVWFPKLYENTPWNNELSDDFKRIIMRNKINPILKDPKEREKWKFLPITRTFK